MARASSSPRRLRTGGAAVFAALVAWVLLLEIGGRDERGAGTLARNAEPVAVDRDLELARAYAPWIWQAIDPVRGRADLPARVDFDGDMAGEGNWDALARFELAPTAYYAVLETATHRFLTYHLFHPRDWAPVNLGLHLTHENDGENLQVVVDKKTGGVVLLFTQAHYRGRAHAPAGAGFGPGAEEVDEALLLVDDEGRASPAGRHACVFVESGGHGIYSLADRCADVRISEGGIAFDGRGLVLRPARRGEGVAEPALDAAEPVPYQLASTAAALWPGLSDGSLVGEGGLFDGALRLETPSIAIDVPRYYEAGRFSGPFGPDRGISPFAVDFRFRRGAVGALFFDPARRYGEVLAVPRPWSLDYVAYPF